MQTRWIPVVHTLKSLQHIHGDSPADIALRNTVSNPVRESVARIRIEIDDHMYEMQERDEVY